MGREKSSFGGRGNKNKKRIYLNVEMSGLENCSN